MWPLFDTAARSSVLLFFSISTFLSMLTGQDLEIKHKIVFYEHERLNLLPTLQPDENDLLFLGDCLLNKCFPI